MALHEIAGGNISDDSYNLVSRLRRPLPPGPDPVKIYAQNFDVELWNSDCLMKMDGDARLYKAEDTGDKKLLSSVSAQKLLALKKGCPVMLIVNLSDELVNGLTGRVVALHENAVEVYFPSIDHHCTLSAFPFSVYDKDKHIDVACRRQVPLKLCFALTVHKAQGLTLNRLSVDCRSMNQNGQIYVALSRATHKTGLQITNFQKYVLKRPSDNLPDFYLQPQKFPKEDLTCCQASFNYTIGCEDSVQTDYDFLFEPEDFDTEDNEMANFVSFIESYDEENISFCLPESVQVDQIISNISPKFVETKEQRDEMEVIRRLKVSENLFKLFQYFWNAFMIIKEKVLPEGKAVSNKVTSEFYREVNQMLISEKTQAITNVFEGDSVAKKNVFYRLSCEVRKLVLEKVAEPIKQKAREKGEKEKGKSFEESAGGRGKIRYIGGWCIHAIKKDKKSNILKNLYKDNKKKETADLRMQFELIQELETTEHELLESSEDQESLQETVRRQNVRKGLTNITDKTFNFFKVLDQKIRQLESTANLELHGSSIHTFIKGELENDQSLFNTFNTLFEVDVDKELSKSLLNEVISKYSLMSLAQLRKTYLKEVKAQKTEAHRKQIKMREKSANVKTSPLSLASIRSDSSENKVVSHRRLQYEILKSESYLSDTITKADLEKICKAYKCPFDKYKSKKHISGTLHNVINQFNCMPDCSVFVDSDVAKVSQPGTSSSVTTCSQPRVDITTQASSGKQVKRVGKTRECSNIPTKKKSYGKSGKRKSKKKSEPKYPCGVCKLECVDDAVGCDGCESWFHADCIHIENLDDLPDEWFCNLCKNELEG